MNKTLATILKIVGILTVIAGITAAIIYYLDKKGIITCTCGCCDFEDYEECDCEDCDCEDEDAECCCECCEEAPADAE